MITNEQIAAQVKAVMAACEHENRRGQYWGMTACNHCTSEAYRLYRTLRKAQLAEQPRCEVSGCKSRGTLTVSRGTLMCARHFHKAENEMRRRMGGFPMGNVYPGTEALIELATA